LAELGRDLIVESGELGIALDACAARNDLAQGERRPGGGHRVGRAQDDDVRSLAEAGGDDDVARRRLIQDVGEHEQTVGRTREAGVGVQRIGDGRGRDAGGLRDRVRDALARRWEYELGHRAWRDIRGGKRGANGFEADLQIAFVANPALFPVVVVHRAGRPEMVDQERGVG
jgi:hypothetical protein